MEYSIEESIRLAAEDLRAARARLGITSAQAARRAGVAAVRYRALEKGSVPSSQDILRKLVSVCRRLDMESVQVAYLEEIGQYANLLVAVRRQRGAVSIPTPLRFQRQRLLFRSCRRSLSMGTVPQTDRSRRPGRDRTEDRTFVDGPASFTSVGLVSP